MKVIAIVGPKGSGKDTFADAIDDEIFEKVLRVSLADGLKKAAANLHGLAPALFFDLDKKDAPLPGGDVTPRDLVIELSDLIRPRYGDTFHVTHRLAQLAKNNPRDVLVVPDLRLMAEYEAMRELFGENLHVVHVDRGKVVAEDAHRTEREHLDILKRDDKHITIKNKGDLTDLAQAARSLLERLKLARYTKAVPENPSLS